MFYGTNVRSLLLQNVEGQLPPPPSDARYLYIYIYIRKISIVLEVHFFKSLHVIAYYVYLVLQHLLYQARSIKWGGGGVS